MSTPQVGESPADDFALFAAPVVIATVGVAKVVASAIFRAAKGPATLQHLFHRHFHYF